MRRFNKIIAGVAVLTSLSTAAFAQQVPNGSFEGEWITCHPWTSAGDKTQGTQPVDWTPSNVGAVMLNMGATTVCSEVTPGFDDKGSAVKLTNGNTLGNNIPAYITLGTPWSTAIGTKGDNKDGGTWGGVEFAYTPDAFTFQYIYEKGEKASVVAYIWKGNWEQASVPGNIVISGNPTKVTMINRDRCVLGDKGPGLGSDSQGGDVTKSEGAALLGFINDNITANTTEWTTYTHEFEYVADGTPEKMNIIIAPDDYFSSNPGSGNSITIDALSFIYYSRLSSLKAGENEIALEDGKYDYDVDATMPEENDFSFVTLGKGAKGVLTLDKDNNKATIAVTNDGADTDGESSHTYTLAFKAAAQDEEGEPKKYSGNIVIRLGGEDEEPSDPIPATITITPTGENKCRFELPDFSLGDADSRIGDIVVNDVTETTAADGTTTYSGKVDKLHFGEDGVFGPDGLVADVTISGTITAAGVVNMKIDVIWYMSPDEADGPTTPIYVTFTTSPTSDIIDACINNNQAVKEYFNLQGQRVAGDALTPGIYIQRQGNVTSKILVK